MTEGQRKTNAIGASIFGTVGSGALFRAGYLMNNVGKYLANIESVSGKSLAEVYYQAIGYYGQAFSIALYGFAFVSAALTITTSIIIWPKTTKKASVKTTKEWDEYN